MRQLGVHLTVSLSLQRLNALREHQHCHSGHQVNFTVAPHSEVMNAMLMERTATDLDLEVPQSMESTTTVIQDIFQTVYPPDDLSVPLPTMEQRTTQSVSGMIFIISCL